MSVLLAEDDARVRAVLIRALGGMGIELVVADSGTSALELANQRREPFTLLVTDVLMPGLGGPALFDRLRERWPALRVLFISGHIADEQVLNVKAQSQVAYLAKPFSPGALREKVSALIEGRRDAARPAGESVPPD